MTASRRFREIARNYETKRFWFISRVFCLRGWGFLSGLALRLEGISKRYGLGCCWRWGWAGGWLGVEWRGVAPRGGAGRRGAGRAWWSGGGGECSQHKARVHIAAKPRWMCAFSSPWAIGVCCGSVVTIRFQIKIFSGKNLLDARLSQLYPSLVFARMWQEIVTPATGHASYADMIADL